MPTKVQRRHTGGLVLGALCLLLAGCDFLGGGTEVDFGDDYRILGLHSDSLTMGPDYQPPHLDGTMLVATVQYSGGCAEHTFTLNWRRHGERTEIWLTHTDPGDPCDALPIETLRLPLPDRLRDRDDLVLLNPHGDAFELQPAVTVDFGDAYEVYHLPPDQPPHFPNPELVGDSLVVAVSYSGGCEDHTFLMHAALDGDAARLWLHHDAHGDACEAYITEERRFAVPDDALAQPHIYLLEPSGGSTPLRLP